MEKLTTKVQTPDQFFWGNGQDIREAILRAACTHCKLYATDIVLFLTGSSLMGLVKSQKKALYIRYRDNGVDWGTVMPGEEVSWGKPNYCLLLTKDGNKITLEEVQL